MKDKDWIEQLQSKMEDHQEPVPGDLWHDIEKSLPEHQAASRPLMGGWRRYAAAAALVAAVIGIGSLMWHGSDTTVDEATTSLADTPSSTTEPEVTHEILAQNDGIDEPSSAPRFSRSVPAVKATTGVNTTNDHLAQDDTHAGVVTQPVSNEETGKDIEDGQTPQLTQENPETSQPLLTLVDGDTSIESTPVNSDIVRPSHKKEPISVGLFASNHVAASQQEFTKFFMSYQVMNDANVYDAKYNPISFYGYTKHHKPVTVGASVRVPLMGRWSLTSGMIYSRLKSETTIQNSHEEQVLHYVGVPLGAIYTIWEYKRFNLYAIGGVQADVNVKATLKESGQANSLSIGKDRVQFSALVGPGVQLDLSRDFGIYVEPTARYYFNNGSHVANYYKEKPWNINFNAGLRLTVK